MRDARGQGGNPARDTRPADQGERAGEPIAREQASDLDRMPGRIRHGQGLRHATDAGNPGGCGHALDGRGDRVAGRSYVTGFRKPGGAEVVENAGLVDVQCEVCHGSGSLHAEDGGDDMSLIKLEVPAELCAGECHTEEHSDTFVYEAYLRDILGAGHGDAKRKLLGDGPTGSELRAAGLAKAGGKCKKM